MLPNNVETYILFPIILLVIIDDTIIVDDNILEYIPIFVYPVDVTIVLPFIDEPYVFDVLNCCDMFLFVYMVE